MSTTISLDRVASGTIALWPNAKPPTGWKICNSTNDTPNLTNNFAIGSTGTSGAYPINQTGGSTQISIAQENMPLGFPELTDNGHTHTTSIKMSYASVKGDVPSGTTGYLSPTSNHPAGYGTTQLTGTSSNNCTGVTIEQKGGGQDYTHIQPYYPLYYIQKI